MTIKFAYNGIKIDGQLYKGSWDRNGYIKDHTTNKVCFETVTFYADRSLPKTCGLTTQNDTDITIDYFEGDRVSFMPDHPQHRDAVEAWKAQEIKATKRAINKYQKRINSGAERRYDQQYLSEAVERLAKLTA